MFSKKIWAIVALATIAFYACKKATNTTIPSSNATLSSMLESVKPKFQNFTIDATTGGTFTCTQGTRIVIPANAFVNSAGIVQTGTVNVKVKELLTKSDMVLSGIMPISNGEVLKSGGELGIFASNSSGTLRLANGKKIEMNIPQDGPADPDMILFNGGANPEATSVNWIATDSLSGSYLVMNGDTIKVYNDSLNWANCDRFIPKPNYISFTVKLTGVTIPDNSPNIHKFVFFDNQNLAWSMMNPIVGNSFVESHTPSEPEHLIATTVVNNKFYAGMLPVTPIAGGVYTIPMIETTPANFKAALDALP